MLLSVKRAIAWAVLTAIAGTWCLPVVSGRHLAPDAEDRLAPVRTEFSLDAAGGEAADLHCPVCHWLHALSGAFTQPSFSPDVLLRDAALAAAPSADRQGRSQVPALPSRAPPAACL